MRKKTKKRAAKKSRNRTVIRAKRVTVLKANGAKKRRNSVTRTIKRVAKKAAGAVGKAAMSFAKNPTPAELRAIYKEALQLDRAGNKKFAAASAAQDKLWAAESGSAEAKRWNAEWKRLETEGAELKKKARAKFDYYDRLKAQQNPKRSWSKKRHNSVAGDLKSAAKGVWSAVGGAMASNPRRRNKAPTISEADIAKLSSKAQAQLRAQLGQIEKREEKATTPAQKKAVAKSRRSFLARLGTRLRVIGQTKKYKVSARDLNRCPRKKIKVRGRHETDALAKAQSKWGSGFDQFRVGNPRYLVTAEKSIKQARDLGILEDRSATAALNRAKKLYGGQGLKKFAAKKRNTNSRSRSHRNSSAEDNRQAFAGSVTAHKEMYFPAGAPHGLSTLGPLVMIRTESGDIKPVAGSACLCQDEKGHLHLGTSKPNAPLYDGPAQSFGKITRVEYRCRKPHLGYPDTVTWFHDFEDPLPILKADGKGGLTIAGGGYRIRREGIVG